MAEGEPRITGGCLCGAVRYRITGPVRDVVNCHCSQCRRTHGTFGAYSECARTDLVLDEDRGLAWYRSSEATRRGFCRQCGASLFWDRMGAPGISVAAGSMDLPTGLKTVRHIFTDDLPDWYIIDDDLERFPQSMAATPLGRRP